MEHVATRWRRMCAARASLTVNETYSLGYGNRKVTVEIVDVLENVSE